jgi:MHS family proline/betaine transporter-like MFS transporter
MPAAARTPLSRTVIFAGTIGNILEWYDFGLYGFFAPVFATVFFPAHDRIASLIGAYGGFAIGFAMRPIGAMVFGHLGDRKGRRFVLVFSVVMMGCATTATALLPTYASAGIAAPILLLLLRLFQGFSVGGEFTGSVAYLVETAPPGRRGQAGSFANIGSTGGVLLAAAVTAAATTFATEAELATWAWRLPFLVGGVIATTGYFLRVHLHETGYEPLPDAHEQPAPLKQAFAEAPGTILRAVLFTSGYGIVNYITMVFLPTYASEFAGIAESRALQINTAAQALALLIVPLSGWLADNAFRRRNILIAAFLGELAFAWAAFALTGAHGLAGLWIAQLMFGALLALIMGTEPAMLSEQFASRYRLSGYSLSFNIGLGLAGGTSPMIATALIGATGSALAPAWYLMFAAGLAAFAIFLMPDRSRAPLP